MPDVHPSTSATSALIQAQDGLQESGYGAAQGIVSSSDAARMMRV